MTFAQPELIWVRGGKWRADRHAGVAVLAELPLLEERVRQGFQPARKVVVDGTTEWSPTARARRRAHWRMLSAHGAVRTRPSDWRRIYGAVLGLEAYLATDAAVHGALDAAARYWNQVKDVPSSFYGDPDDPDFAVIASRLLTFLSEFGPLSYLYGLVEPPVGTPSAEIGLLELDSELNDLGEAWFRSRSEGLRPGDYTALRRRVIAESAPALREASITAIEADNGSVALQAVPDTLRSRMWLRLIQDYRAGGRGCRWCGGPVVQPTGRHPPFRYCEQHREPVFRQRVRRGIRGDFVPE